MGSRRRAREIAMHVLYTIDICNLNVDEAWNTFLRKYNGTRIDKVLSFAKQLVQGVVDNKPEIDAYITKFAKNWEIHRMASVDRSVLRIASFELLFLPEIPVSVAINEAVEVAKMYSTKDSGKFVNGVLDKIRAKRKPVEKK